MTFVELGKHFPARNLEWLSSGILASWGAYVLLHPGMFTTGPAQPIFSGLDYLAPQEVWGIGAFGSGLMRAGALYVNGRHHRTPLVRLIVSFVAIFFWFWITVGMMKAGIPQMGLIIYPWLAAADIYSAYRAASDVIEARVQYRLEKMTEEASRVTTLRRG